ncbi:MAG: tyrosine-type recombinase/integrase [Prevotella sp.]
MARSSNLGMRPSTVKNYITALNSLSSYTSINHERHLSPSFLLQYESWLKANGKNKNTSSCYMRSLRSLFNKCFPDYRHPFGKTFTGQAKTEKRALSLDTMRRMMKSAWLVPAALRVFYDIFLFSVLGLGIPFVDVSRLTKGNIHGNMLVYHRRKTGERISVPILPTMAEILSRYDTDREDGLLFPVLQSPSCQQDAYHNALGRYNRALGKIRKSLGIDEKLTSYVARHTWATVANEAGISVKNISNALGHHSLQTTEIYLRRGSCEALWHDSVVVERYLNEDNEAG